MSGHRQRRWQWFSARWGISVALALALALWCSAGLAQEPGPKPGPAEKPAAKAPDVPDETGPDVPEKPEPKPGEKPPVEKPGTEKPPVEKPAAKPPVEKPGTEKPPVEKPGEKPPVEKPVAKPGTEKPGTEKPAAKPPEKPVVAKEKPAAPPVELEVDESLGTPANITYIRGLLAGGVLTPQQLAQVKDYYEKFALPRWTHEASRADVRGYRVRHLFDGELKKAKEPAHGQVIAIVLPFLNKMAAGNHIPVARVNAMLAIGELNDAEGAPPNTLPVPCAAAQPILIAAVNDEDLSDPVRIAALVGIGRHAELKAISGNELNGAVAALTTLATAVPAAGRTPSGHAWMRCMAIDVLGQLGTPGQNGEAVKTLSQVLGDDNAPLSVRSAAALALGRITYPGGFQTDVGSLVRQMGKLALDAGTAEVQRFQKEKGELGRRPVQARMIDAYNGLSGIAALAAAQPPNDALHAKVLKLVKDCLTALENDKEKDNDSKVAAELSRLLAQLSQALTAPAAAPAAAKPSE